MHQRPIHNRSCQISLGLAQHASETNIEVRVHESYSDICLCRVIVLNDMHWYGIIPGDIVEQNHATETSRYLRRSGLFPEGPTYVDVLRRKLTKMEVRNFDILPFRISGFFSFLFGMDHD